MTVKYALTAISTVTLLALAYSLRKRGTKNLPPGPKGSFLVGNVAEIQLEGDEKAKACLKWPQEYGEIMHLQVFGNHIIVLNSAKAASDLMDKHAEIYSHRPRMPMLNEVIGLDWVFPTGSGEMHKERRSLAQQYFVTQLKDWHRAQVDTAWTLLRNLSVMPDEWPGLIRLSIASSILRIFFGYEVTRPDDPLLKIAQDSNELPANGPYLVDAFPFLKYYPSWLPGGEFHKDAAVAREAYNKLRYVPFDYVRKEMAAGTASPSFVSTLLSQLPPEEDNESSHSAELIRDSSAVMYSAAMDSISSFIHTFLAAMVLYPDVQRRAQTELDIFLGQDRLPTFEDRTLLPFIDGIVLEIFRWNVVTPLGFPHMATQDDEYLGYQIPKGTTVFGNMWAIFRDPVAFPNPDVFDPCRFLADTKGSVNARQVLESTVYGWGKRRCPARSVGYSAVFIMISNILACFEVLKRVDEAGNEVDLGVAHDDKSLVRRARAPNCALKVRRPDRIANLELMAGNYA